MTDTLELQRTFQALPGLFLALRPDAAFSVIAASGDYLRAIRADASVFGQPLQALFPDPPTPAGAQALQNLRASLQRVLVSRSAEKMPVQQFDLRLPASAGAGIEERFWWPVNAPVLAEDGSVEFVVHRVHEAAAKANQDAIGILDSIGEGFYTLDRQWRFDYVNREAQRILGRGPGELQGQVVWQAYPGLEGTEIERGFLRAMLQREKNAFTAYYEGHARWYEITIFPAPEGISVFFRDVTAQRAMQAQRDALLAESERQRRIYETALDSTPDFVSVFGLQLRVLYANAALTRTWGVPDARGMRLGELGYEPWHAALHEAEIGRAIATRAPVRGEVRFTGTGGTRLYDYIFAPVFGDAGDVVAAACTARDITERQQLTERLVESQRLEAIGTLAGGVAHDFNNVLAAILVNVALAEQEIAPASPALERLHLVHRAAERARSLVRQILTFSRRAPRLQQVQRLQPLVDEAIALLRSTLPPSVLLVARHASPALCASVDGAQFQQLVVNLCANAWQALPAGRGRVRVSLAPTALTPARARTLQVPAGDCVRLFVSDNGMGMDEAVRVRIFEPFFTTRPHGGGTGLGLAVVHGVVSESGGAIRVRSRPGRGTCIAVYLPRQPEPAAAEPAPPPADARAVPAARLLYVDDDEVVSLTAAALLSRAGFGVTCVADGHAALSALREAPGAFVAVVTDFNMPQMSGLAVAEGVASHAPGTPVVIVSGLVTDELQAAAARLGVREVVFKEHMLERLVEAVHRALAPEGPGAGGSQQG